MASAREEIPIVVLSEASPTSPVAGATATVKNRATGEAAVVFSDSGSTNNTVSQPMSTDSAGRLTGWLPRGAYQFEITVSGKVPYTEYLDVAPGTDGAVEAAWIGSEAVETAKIKALAVTEAKLAAEAVGAGKIKSEAVETGKIKSEAVTAAKLGAEAVETAKIKGLAVTAGKLAAESKPVIWYPPKIIPGEESRENAAFGKMPTPDEITGVVVPNGGLIAIGYTALWKDVSAANPRAAIFIGANQLKNPISTGVPVVQEARGSGIGGTFSVLGTTGAGLDTGEANGATFVTTGQTLTQASNSNPGICYAWVEAGTYAISVQYRSSPSGAAVAKERKLWVYTLGY